MQREKMERKDHGEEDDEEDEEVITDMRES
jgi:hypothetical protein